MTTTTTKNGHKRPRRQSPAGYSRLRQVTGEAFGLAIPAEFYRALQTAFERGDLFKCELVDDGILFRAVDDDESIEIPMWAKTRP